MAAKFRPTPNWVAVGLFLAICLLWLSERLQWFGFNHRKGWTVLIAVAAVGVAILMVLLWWAAGLLFRWRFRFGIWSLMVFAVASSIASAWLAAEINRARRHADAVAAIRRLGWDPKSEWNTDAYGQIVPNAQPPGPEWLIKILGVDFFSKVYEVLIDRNSCSDASLEILKGVPELSVLSLDGTKVTDAGLKRLQGLSRLLSLDLSDTAITDAGMGNLGSFKGLQELYLSRTRITDAGLGRLVGLTQLIELSLDSCKVTDAGLKQLASLPRLELLNLNGDQITDSGLEHLKSFKQLRKLFLADTKITDAGLQRLKELKQLDELMIPWTNVTDAGVRAFQRVLPKCNLE